jgi:hypothetical protein
VEIEKFLEFGPEDHAYLAEVAVQGRAVLLGEVASVPVVYRQHQQYGVDVVSGRNTAFEVVEEELNAGSEKRPEDLCGAVASHIEKLCSKDDLMQHPIDEGLVDGLEGLLQGEFLSLL